MVVPHLGGKNGGQVLNGNRPALERGRFHFLMVAGPRLCHDLPSYVKRGSYAYKFPAGWWGNAERQHSEVLPFNLAPHLDRVSRSQQGIPFRSTDGAAAPGKVWAVTRQASPRRAAPWFCCTLYSPRTPSAGNIPGRRWLRLS